MPCSNCNSTPTVFDVQYFYSSQCNDCSATDCPTGTMSSRCVTYLGGNLTCSGILNNDSLELSLQKIDTQICSLIGDYSTYQFNCLTAWLGTDITEESQFVDAITSYACEIREDVDTFIDTTFPTTLDDRIEPLEVPGITCSSASVVNTDTLVQVLNKYCTKFATIDNKIDISSVVWNSCFTVPSPPLNIAEGFSLLADQICQVQEASSTLPTFDNSINCLSGTSTDTLVETIDLITERLCSTEPFDSSAISWGCLDDSATTLQVAFQTVVSKVSSLQQNFVTFDETDFVVTATDGGDECQGITVSLATPIDQDRFVAVNGSDTSPGTLVDKLVAGTGISFTVAGDNSDITINSSGDTDNFTVKANEDGDPGFLDEKISGSTDSGLSLTPNYDSGSDQLQLLLSVDRSAFFTALLNQMNVDPDLRALFCNMVAACPSPCASPDNVQVSLITTTTTTTTTTLP